MCVLYIISLYLYPTNIPTNSHLQSFCWVTFFPLTASRTDHIIRPRMSFSEDWQVPPDVLHPSEFEFPFWEASCFSSMLIFQITHLERKMIWTKPPWGHVPAVNLPGCNLLVLKVFFKGTNQEPTKKSTTKNARVQELDRAFAWSSWSHCGLSSDSLYQSLCVVG